MLQVDSLSISGRLSPLSFTLKPGSLTLLTGPNGSGKTTLLKTIAGLIRPTTGRITWNSENLQLLSRKELSTLLFLAPQETIVPFDFTALEIAAMASSEKKALNALSLFDASHLRDRPITELSSGEKQRIYLARSFATDCPLLLFDEPTANLDTAQKDACWQHFHRLANEGRSLLIATHDIISQTDEIKIETQRKRDTERGLKGFKLF